MVPCCRQSEKCGDRQWGKWEKQCDDLVFDIAPPAHFALRFLEIRNKELASLGVVHVEELLYVV
jgi:hypothetical protein